MHNRLLVAKMNASIGHFPTNTGNIGLDDQRTDG